MTAIDRARSLLQGGGPDLLLVTPSADLVYLTGYAGHTSERPTILAVSREGPTRVLMPQLEAPRFPDVSEVDVITYDETEDPYRRLTDALGGVAPDSVALSDQAWAVILMRLQEVWPATQFGPATPLLRELRMRKTADEIEALAQAGHIDDEIFTVMAGEGFESRTEKEIGRLLETLLRERGLTDVWQIVAAGPHSASPHHFSGDRVIRAGDAVVLDYGGALNGYQADITRTLHVGPPDDEFVHVYEVVRQAQDAAVAAAGPQIRAEAVDAAARSVIDAAGYGNFFIHRTGHGIGLDVHEEPYIVAGNDLSLQPGMTFSIEPGVYLPGRFGVRIEDIVAVTESGSRRLNQARRELTVL